MKPIALAVLTAFFFATALQAAEVKMTPVFTGLKFERPITLLTPPDGTKRQFLVEQTGKIKILPKDGASEPAVFLDFTDREMAEKEFEEGLLGLAFHPKYAENGKFYVYYSQQGPKRSVISEFEISKTNANQADLASERILMTIPQPEWNHNSGNMFFGPKDGLLYICVGDGGLKNGVFMLAQKLTQWNGKVLRIDVDGRTGKRPYGIPADNPFVSTKHAATEIYAYGLRNPWGAYMDPETGLFWLADVGQDLYEEVNLIEKGKNYGWEYREGKHPFFGRDLLMDALANPKGKEVPAGAEFAEPVFEYDRTQGFSITGGYVYRGAQVPALTGYYLTGDWKTGNTWAIKYDPAQGKVVDEKKIYAPPIEEKFQPTAFVPGLEKEALILNWDGRIFRLDPAG